MGNDQRPFPIWTIRLSVVRDRSEPGRAEDLARSSAGTTGGPEGQTPGWRTAEAERVLPAENGSTSAHLIFVSKQGKPALAAKLLAYFYPPVPIPGNVTLILGKNIPRKIRQLTEVQFPISFLFFFNVGKVSC